MRRGYTTGVCAAAAAKASAWMLLTGRTIDSIHLKWTFGRGESSEADFTLCDALLKDGWAECAVRKDAGDDPDVTDGMLIYAKVRRQDGEIQSDSGKNGEVEESAGNSQDDQENKRRNGDAAGSDNGMNDQKITIESMAGPDGVIPFRWNVAADYINSVKKGDAVSAPEMQTPAARASDARAENSAENEQRGSSYEQYERFEITGGRGVGTVTKPGLDQPVGAAAINSGPRRMISQALEDVCEDNGYEGGLAVEISVPGGEEAAEKTFNPVLGIEGGISILGTTGIVEPMSGRAVEETVRAEVRVKSADSDFLAFVPGNAGMDFVKNELRIPEKKIVTISNYPGAALDEAAENGVKSLLIAGSLGKLVKLAGGIFNTHSHEADARIDIIIRSALRAGTPYEILHDLDRCVTTDAACDLLDAGGYLEPAVKIITERAHSKIKRRVPDMRTELIILKNTGEVLGFTESAFDLAEDEHE
ncbi:MAG: cobalt-precorrin-5B (C(1))-methyltransferase CbiD [Anaerovoracaceae bacterium]|jgi:cobalt-precorrin-5B (C1)-methyltransferase